MKKRDRIFLSKSITISLVSLLIMVFLSVVSCHKEVKQAPNILLIAVDDLKPILGCYGDEKVVSPNIDALADEGVIFTNSHCQQAVCAPSRASLLTGLRPDRTKVWDLKTLIRDKNPDIVTLPQYYKENGYETAAVGKIFDLRSVDKEHDAVSWTVPYVHTKGGRWYKTKEKVSTQIVDAPDSILADGWIAGRAVKLLDRFSASKKPFFLAVGFKKPHLPFVAPRKYWNLYKREDFRINPYQEHAEGTPEFAYQPGWELRNGYSDTPEDESIPIPEETQLRLIHGYYASVSFVDAQIGRVLDELRKKGLDKNTLIVLWGDHGWHLGDHGMWCKHTNFEQATRAPLIFAGPGLKGIKQNNSPTEFVDIFPTLCEAAGLAVPENLDGKSLLPVITGKKKKVKNYSVSQFHRYSGENRLEGYAIRTERYRYVVWIPVDYRLGTVKYDESKVIAAELYDYEKDPNETKNLAGDPAYKEVKNKLKKYMREFLTTQKHGL
jgi:arylsulfatase A-like enzyme